MTFEAYEAFEDPYCYRGSTVLKNLLDLRQQTELDQFEVEMSGLRSEEPFPDGLLDADHYRRVHHHLFQDIYAWAGEYRTVRISKGGNAFCYPEYIREQMESVFQEWPARKDISVQTTQSLLTDMANFLAEVNAIHPFRDGNGRTQLSFCALVAAHAGRPLDLARVRRESWLPAMIASFRGNKAPLLIELERLIRP